MPKQLTGLDSTFLYLENSRTPLEVSSLHFYDPSTAPNKKVRFKEILATFQSRLPKSKVFQRKLQEVPFALDHPYWVEDPAFDLEYHLRHVSLPKPGDWRQLMILVARLQSRELDKSKPLWEAYIIEGLDNIEFLPKGCFAMFMKMHHATVDGASGQEIQVALHDLNPVQADADSYQPVRGRKLIRSTPGWSLAARSPFNNARNTLNLMRGVANVLPAWLKATVQRNDDPAGKPPLTLFNDGRISPHRVVDGRVLDLEQVKAIARAVPEATVNDVVLTIVSGALREYLDAYRDLPESSLIAACPVNVRDESHKDMDTMVSLMNTSLHTDIADPIERMQAIHAGTQAAKEHMEAVGTAALTEIPMHLPAPIARGLLPPLAELAIRMKALSFNTMITNVAGIQRPIYLAGAKMVSMMGMGPVTDQAGLFHAVFSYNGGISIAFTGCREMLPDPAFYAECLEDAYRELADAATPETEVTIHPHVSMSSLARRAS